MLAMMWTLINGCYLPFYFNLKYSVSVNIYPQRYSQQSNNGNSPDVYQQMNGYTNCGVYIPHGME